MTLRSFALGLFAFAVVVWTLTHVGVLVLMWRSGVFAEMWRDLRAPRR